MVRLVRRYLVGLVIVTACLMVASVAMAQFGEDFVDLPPIDRPVAQTDQGARDVAIIIAVEQYHNLTNVAGAEITGLDWKAFFRGQMGLDEDRILLITNARAVPSVINREVPQHLEKVGEEGRVWFVFIGHGAPDPTDRSPEGLFVGAAALNHTAEDFRTGSMAQSEVEEMLAQGRQGQTIMVIDACFSGQSEYGQSLTGTQAVVPDPSRLQFGLGERDIVFSAARHDEAAHSLPGPTVDRPAFSYALLGAFRGWADTTGDGNVTPAEAENYVRRAMVGMQTPSVTVRDHSVRQVALVTGATEDEPGFATTLQSLINRGRAFAAAEPCEVEGQVRNVDTQGACCWPGQAYSSHRESCVGIPECPDGLVYDGSESCQNAEEGQQGYASSVNRDEGCTTAVQCRQMGHDAYRGRGGKRDFERAAQLYQEACERGDAEGCYLLGELSEQLEVWDEAIAGFQRYVDEHDGDRIVHLRLALLEGERGQWGQSYERLENYLERYGDELKPHERVEVFVALGLAMEEIPGGDWGRADEYYSDAVGLWSDEPVWRAAYGAEAEEYRRQSSHAAAEARFRQGEHVFEQFLSVGLSWPPERLVEGAKTKAELQQRAEDIYREVVEMRSAQWTSAAAYRIGQSYMEFAEALFDLPLPEGLLPDQEFEYEMAIEELAFPLQDRALETMSQAHQVALTYGTYTEWAQLAARNISDWESAIFPVTEVEGVKAEHYSTPGVELRTGNQWEVRRAAEEVLRADPNDVEALLVLGALESQRGNPSAAWVTLRQAWELDDGRAELWNNLGLVALAEGDATQAVEHFRRAARSSGSHVESRLNLGAVLLEFLDYERSLEAFGQVLEAESTNCVGYLGKGAAAFGMKEFETSVASLEYYLNHCDSDHVDTLEMLVALYQHHVRKLPKAIQYCERLLELVDDPVRKRAYQAELQFMRHMMAEE